MNDTDKQILITGATGSLGKQLIYELHSKGVKAIAHHRNSSDTSYIDSLGLEKRVADLRNQPELDKIMLGVYGVIHTAAWVNFRRDKLTQFTGTNTFGAVNMYRAARKAGVKRFVHVSTIAAVGARDRREGHASNGNITKPKPVNEDMSFNLERLHIPYILTKRAAEVELLKEAEEGGPELVIVNPSIIVAPSSSGNDREKATSIYSRPFMPDFPNWLNLVDIRDLAPAIIAALERGRHRERYILSGDNVTARDIVLSISAIVGKVPHLLTPPRGIVNLAARLSLWYSVVINSGKIRFYPDLVKMMDYDWLYSSKKAREELSFKSRSVYITLEDLFTNNFAGTPAKP